MIAPIVLDVIGIYQLASGNTFTGIPSWVWFQVAFIFLIIIPFIAYHKLRMKMPKETHLVWSGKGWENVKAPLYSYIHGFAPQVIGEPVFSHAIFANDPEDSRKGITAEKVVAHLEILNDSQEVLFTMIGRWSETPERAQVGARVVDTTQIDIAPNAMPRALDIILKYDDEDNCYGLNNETPQRDSHWRDKSRELPPGSYIVKIRLRGNNIDQEFWLDLVNEGAGREVSLSPCLPHLIG